MEHLLVYGAQATAARRLGVGERVTGRGTICQRIPSVYLDRVGKEASRQASEAAQARGVDLAPIRKRIYETLREHNGAITTREMIKRFKAEGIVGVPYRMFRVARRHLGLPKDSRTSMAAARVGRYSRNARNRANPPRAIPGVKVTPPKAEPMELADPKILPTPYLRACVVEWNERVRKASEIIDLATDPIRADPRAKA